MKRVTVLLIIGFILLAVIMPRAKQGSAQETSITAQNLNQMIANAKTPADHEAVAAYYDKEAAQNEEMMRMHRASQNIYTKSANRLHCGALINGYRMAADANKALAASHREMAKKLPGSH